MYINDRVITTQFLKYFDESAMEENPTSPPLPETEDTMVERAEPLVNNNIVEELKDPIMAKVVETTKCKWFGKLPIAKQKILESTQNQSKKKLRFSKLK